MKDKYEIEAYYINRERERAKGVITFKLRNKKNTVTVVYRDEFIVLLKLSFVYKIKPTM